MTRVLPYPPPWQDSVTLAAHISVSVSTLENWVTAGIIPPPRKRGGKLMWRWSEVDARLAEGENGALNDATRIRDAVRAERENESRAGY